MTHLANPPRRPRARAGFTLVELMVVILIIAVLAGLGVGIYAYAMGRAAHTATVTAIKKLEQSASTYKEAWGEYPPTLLDEIGVRGGSAANQGIETLLLCLTSERGRAGWAPMQIDEQECVNADNDRLVDNVTKSTTAGNKLLYEVKDGWNHPLIYVRADRYAESFTATDDLGAAFAVTAHRDAGFGGYTRKDSFQIWSIGADGQNENGDGDDVGNW